MSYFDCTFDSILVIIIVRHSPCRTFDSTAWAQRASQWASRLSYLRTTFWYRRCKILRNRPPCTCHSRSIVPTCAPEARSWSSCPCTRACARPTEREPRLCQLSHFGASTSRLSGYRWSQMCRIWCTDRSIWGELPGDSFGRPAAQRRRTWATRRHGSSPSGSSSVLFLLSPPIFVGIWNGKWLKNN